MIDLLAFVQGFRGQLQAQLLKHIDVHAGKHDRGVDLAAPQLGKLLQGGPGILVRGRAGGEGDEDLVRVEPWIAASQIPGLKSLDGLNKGRGNQVNAVGNAA